MAGAEIVQQFPFGPMTGAAANLTLLSYLDDLHIGINVDPAVGHRARRLLARCLRRRASTRSLAVG